MTSTPLAFRRLALRCGQALALPLLLAAGAAQAAGPSQASVTLPGGFASACASEISSGVTYTPGLDLTAGFDFWPGRFSCQGNSFSGAAGMASAAAQWSTAGVANATSVQAAMGQVRLQSNSNARGNIQFPVAVAGGGWSDSMVVNSDGHAGEAGIWRFQVAVDGHLLAGGGSATVFLNGYGNGRELSKFVSGFDKGGSDTFTSDRQRVRWAVARTGDRAIVDLVTFAVPITIGQSFSWGVYGTVSAGLASYSASTALAAASADFAHTLRYAGSLGVEIGGVVQGDAQLNSLSGIDWRLAVPVPEPGAGALMVAGLLLLPAALRRRAGLAQPRGFS